MRSTLKGSAFFAAVLLNIILAGTAIAENWDKSTVVVSGQCGICPIAGLPNGAVFTACNHGSAMAAPTSYNIFHNSTLFSSGPIQLGPQGSQTACRAFCDGFAGSVKLIVYQRPGHPGHSVPQQTLNCPVYTATATATSTKTNTPTATKTNSATATSTKTATQTATNTFTATLTNTPIATNTPTFTATRTATYSPTNTVTATKTNTASATHTSTATATSTSTSTPTKIATHTATNTSTSTNTAAPTNTATATATHTATSSATSTATATNTTTASATATSTATSTGTKIATHTATSTFTFTHTPTPTSTPTPSSYLTICHKVSTSPALSLPILILPAELATHLAHGDVQGICPVDCMGITGGQAVIDRCGICGGDNSTCNVTLCDNNIANCNDCRGIPNGGAVIDVCGVCNGASNTCLDCAGVPNGTARQDDCGICNGTNSTCDISQICKGTIDLCGVRNGNNACLDCAGIPNGGTKLDCCGVCGGDGNSCPELCKFYDLKKDKKKIANSVKSLLKSIKKYSTQATKCSASGKKAAIKRITLAENISQETLNLFQSFVADRVKLCDTIFCSKSSLESINNNAKSNIKKLFKLSKTSQYAASKSCNAGPRKNGKPGKSTSDLNQGLNGIGKIPDLQCVN